MKKETFGSGEQYKMLDFLTEKLNNMDGKYKAYVSSLISDFNMKLKKTNSIEDTLFKNYILDLIYHDYIKKIDMIMTEKYSGNVISYLKNFLKAKINNHKI